LATKTDGAGSGIRFHMLAWRQSVFFSWEGEYSSWLVQTIYVISMVSRAGGRRNCHRQAKQGLLPQMASRS